jgi:phosphoribosyl-dephospho-CoA transferase
MQGFPAEQRRGVNAPERPEYCSYVLLCIRRAHWCGETTQRNIEELLNNLITHDPFSRVDGFAD